MPPWISSPDVKRTVLLFVVNGCPLIAASPFQRLEIFAQDNPRRLPCIPLPPTGRSCNVHKLATAVRRALRCTPHGLFKPSLVAWDMRRLAPWRQ